MGTHLEKSPSVNYGDTFGKIAKYKLGGHIWIEEEEEDRRECSNPKRKIGQNCQTKNGLKWPFLGRFSKINPESCSTLLVLSYRSIKS